MSLRFCLKLFSKLADIKSLVLFIILLLLPLTRSPLSYGDVPTYCSIVAGVCEYPYTYRDNVILSDDPLENPFEVLQTGCRKVQGAI